MKKPTGKAAGKCGYGQKDYAYNPKCGCCRCSVERVVWRPVMRGLRA